MRKSTSRFCLYSSLVLAALWNAGCVANNEDIESVDTAAEAARIASWQPDPSLRHFQCEGYTSGGGQRVRGDIWLTWLPAADGTSRGNWAVIVQAENWKKNIGWNTKRTTALKIEGTVSARNILSVAPGEATTVRVNIDTGGDLKKRIRGAVWTSPVMDASNYALVIDAQLVFHGRDGTTCSI